MRLFGKRPEPADDSATTTTCIHGVLIASWDRLEDMGHEERATHYRCEACGQIFTPAEARLATEQRTSNLVGR